MITTITGDNDFGRQQALDEIVSEFLTEHDQMAIERLDGEEVPLNRLTESLSGVSLFSEDKLVIIRAPGTQKAFAEASADLLASVPATTQVVLLEPKLDKRTAYYKYLKTNTNFIQCDTLEPRQLGRWITEVAKAQEGTITASDAQYLIDRVGANQQQLQTEINKLLNFDPHITRQTIDRLTDLSPQGTVFELLDAAFAGRTQRALDLYHNQRQQKIEPLAIIGMLAWQLHAMAVAQAAGPDIDDRTIAKDAGLNPFVVSKSRRAVRHLTRAQLQKLIQRLLQLDVDLKSKTLNADDAVSQFIIEVGQVTS